MTQPLFRTRTVRPDSGFSLIELMVVMVLVVGLFGLVGTSIFRSVGGAELRNEVREIIAGLRHTRGQAIIKRTEMVFRADADKLTWQAAGQETRQLPCIHPEPSSGRRRHLVRQARPATA